MSSINNGSQIITVDYKEFALSHNIDKLLRDIALPGISKGGLLTRLSDTQVAVNPFTALFQTDFGTAPNDHLIAVRVITQNQVAWTVTEASPYLVMKLPWVEVPDNYIDFEFGVGARTPTLNGLIVLRLANPITKQQIVPTRHEKKRQDRCNRETTDHQSGHGFEKCTSCNRHRSQTEHCREGCEQDRR